MPLQLTIIGGPASGKSTLTDLILEANPSMGTFGVRRHFIEQIRQGTEVGLAAKAVVEAGGWIPDELVAKAVRLEFERGRFEHGAIFEGMPGNRRQAELLDEILDERGTPLTAAVLVDTPEELARERASMRVVCNACDGGSHQAVEDPAHRGRCARCGGPIEKREGDAPELFVQRLELYRRLGPELVGYYRGDRLVEVDGRLPPEAMLSAAIAGIERRRLRAAEHVAPRST